MNPTITPELRAALGQFKFPAYYEEDDRSLYDQNGATIVEINPVHLSSEQEPELGEFFTDCLNKAMRRRNERN